MRARQNLRAELRAAPNRARKKLRARLVVALGDAHRVDAAVEERLGHLEQRAREHDDARRAVADLVVLRLRELDEELADLVLHLHLLEDGGAVVGDAHVAVGRLQHLVHPLRPERRAQRRAHRLRREDVRLLRLDPTQPPLGRALLDDDEGAAVLVEGERHGAHARRKRKSTWSEGVRGEQCGMGSCASGGGVARCAVLYCDFCGGWGPVVVPVGGTPGSRWLCRRRALWRCARAVSAPRR